MKLYSVVTLSIFVVLVYHFSYVQSSPTDSTPILAPFEDLVSRSDISSLQYLADVSTLENLADEGNSDSRQLFTLEKLIYQNATIYLNYSLFYS